jgi:hypothetical protein
MILRVTIILALIKVYNLQYVLQHVSPPPPPPAPSPLLPLTPPFSFSYHHCPLCPQSTQSRQSAKLFLKSSKLGLPQPLTRRRLGPPPGSGGRGTLAGERVVGRVPIPTTGHTRGYSFLLCACALPSLPLPPFSHLFIAPN